MIRILKLAKLVLSFLSQRGNLAPPPCVLKSLLINSVRCLSSLSFPALHRNDIKFINRACCLLIECMSWMKREYWRETQAVIGCMKLTSRWHYSISFHLHTNHRQQKDLVLFTLLFCRYQRHYKIYIYTKYTP